MPHFPKAALQLKVKQCVIALAVVPLLASCIISQHPLSKTSYEDEYIVGHWTSFDNGNNPLELNITRLPDGKYKVAETELDAHKKPHTKDYICILTRGKHATFVNMEFPTPKVKNKTPTQASDYKTGYLIYRYWCDRNQLTLRSFNYDKLKDAIIAKRLQGTFSENTWDKNVDITDTPERLLAMLDQPSGEQFFDNEISFDKLDRSQVTSEVQDVLRKQAEAWNEGDLEKFMAAYVRADDTSYVSAEGAIYGYDALMDRYQRRYGSNRDTMGKLSFYDLNVRPVGPKNALCIGNWHVKRPDPQPELKGVFSLVMVKTDDGWKVIHDHTSMFPPPEPPR